MWDVLQTDFDLMTVQMTFIMDLSLQMRML